MKTMTAEQIVSKNLDRAVTKLDAVRMTWGAHDGDYAHYDDGAQVAELRETDRRAIDAPHLGVRLAEAESIHALALPSRSASEPLEAAAPRLVELDEELSAHVSRRRALERFRGHLVRLLGWRPEGVDQHYAATTAELLSWCRDKRTRRTGS